MKRSYILFLGLYFMAMSCAKNPPLPTTEEVKNIILKDIKENILKYIRTDDYDDLDIEVANIKQSKDFDPKTKRVSYRYTASFTAYKNQQIRLEQKIFNTLPLEYIADIGWRKRDIQTKLEF